MSERAHGADIHPDYQAGFVDQGNLDFIKIQFTNGIQEQKGLEEIWDEVSQVPVVIGYHYMRSYWSANAQVDAFLEVAEKYPVHGFTVDFEKRGNVRGKEYALKTLDVMDQLREIMRTVLYSGRYDLQDWMYDWTKFPVEDPETYPLHIAQYPYKGWNATLGSQVRNMDMSDGVVWSPVLPAGIVDWVEWQYSADGNKQGPIYGLPKPNWWTIPAIDLNVFNGTVQDMRVFWGVDQEDPDPVLPALVNCDDAVRAGQIEVLDLMTDSVSFIKNNL